MQFDKCERCKKDLPIDGSGWVYCGTCYLPCQVHATPRYRSPLKMSDGAKATAAYNKLMELNTQANRLAWLERNGNPTTGRGVNADALRRRMQSRAILGRFAKRLARKHLRDGGFPSDILNINSL